jgi:hypothetical protein
VSVGEQADSLDKYQGLILTDREMDDEWTDNTSANLKPQAWQPIVRLAELKGIKLEAFDDLPESRGDRLFSRGSTGVSLELPESFGKGTRAMDLVTLATHSHVGDSYFLFFRLRVSS